MGRFIEDGGCREKKLALSSKQSRLLPQSNRTKSLIYSESLYLYSIIIGIKKKTVTDVL